MADLTNRSVASSYKELLKTASGDGLSATLTAVEDGDATASSLQLATDSARFTGTLQTDGITTIANTTESTGSNNGSLQVFGGVGVAKNLNVGGNLEVTGTAVIQGTLTANGGTLTLGNEGTDNVVFQADVNSDIRPNVNDTYSLGTLSLQWRDLHLDGTAFIDNLDVHDSALITPVGPVTISPSSPAGTLVINPAGTSSMNNVTIGATTPRDATFTNLTALDSLVISANTGSSNKDTGALVVEGGVGIEQNLNVGGNSAITGDLAVNGGDLTTTAATFNLINANATTVNLAGAATAISIGAATGTTTINHSVTLAGGAGQTFAINDGSINRFTVDSINGNIVTDGDLAVNGGDITTSQAAFNLLNATATTVNFAGAATTVEIGSATGTTNVNNNLDVDGDLNIDGGDLTVSTATFNLANTTASTVNAFGAGTAVNIGAITGTTTVRNNAQVNGILGVTGAVTLANDIAVNGGDLTTNQTTFNLLNATATTVNFAGAATTLEIGAATGTTNVNNNLDVDGDVNIDGGDLTVSTATFNLANTAATTLNVGGAATTVELGAATGTTNINNNLVVDLDLQVKGGDITTDQTTFNLLNTTATTLNVGGAATTVEIGAASGTTNVNNNLDVDGDLNIDGGDLTVSTATFNLANTTATTVNAFGAGTAVSIGATTGTTTVRNNAQVDGTLGVTGNQTNTGDLTVNGNATLGNATSDSVTFNARSASSLVPVTDNSVDLGTSTLEWRDIFIDGTTRTDTLTVDENATVAGTLGVTGAASLSSTLGVSDTISATKASGTGLAVTANATVGGDLTVTGNLTVNGTTTNINTTNLVVEDKNVILGDVAVPTDVTADGGGLTLKGATDKTLNWVDATDAWTSSEHLELASGKTYRINGNSVLSANTLGSGVTASSLTSTGTVTSGTWSSTIAVNDNLFTIRDNSDNTKQVQFEVSGITSGQTRTLTVADTNQTVVGFTGTSTDTWTWDTDFDHMTVVIPGVGTRKIPYYA